MAAIRLAPSGAASGPQPPALIEPALIEPALIEDGDVLLAADITVHDRARLRLPDQGMDRSDGAFLRVVLAGRGAEALGDLHGDFAFADWRDGCLTLGRDHFGARPLVYAEAPGRYLAFASSPTALLRTGLAGTALDEAVGALGPGGWAGPIGLGDTGLVVWLFCEARAHTAIPWYEAQLQIESDLLNEERRSALNRYVKKLEERASFTDLNQMGVRLLEIAQERYHTPGGE